MSQLHAHTRVCIQTQDFDVSEEVAALRAGDRRVGAVVSFVGTVRDMSETQTLARLELEHYAQMTQKSIEAMVEQALERFDIYAARVIHRVGALCALEQIVFVGVSAAHRGEAFRACEFLMDYLKTRAPFWKKEYVLEGGTQTGRWVQASSSDDLAAGRWQVQ